MTKIDKTRPDMIKLHEKAPDLAVRILNFDFEVVKLEEELDAIKHKLEMQFAIKTVIFDELKKRFEEDLKVISPENDIKYEIDKNEVYIIKENSEKVCPGCGKVHPPFGSSDGIKKLFEKLAAGGVKVGGIHVGTIEDLPDDLKDLFKGKKE